VTEGGVAISETVFISYSHDSAEHIHCVLELSNRLRSEGVDAVLDQYEESPPEGWPRWMDLQIRKATFVLLVCTETYFRRVMGQEVERSGLGVRWEGNLVYQHFYNDGALNQRFIPVVFAQDDTHYIPTPFQGTTHYRVDTPDGYERLYMRLTGQKRVEKPPLGDRRSLPKREVKTDPSMYLTGPIDVELWDAAKWSGAYFLWQADRPPVLGLAFKNEGAARRIFEGWLDRYGDHDEDEELRIAVIEGNIPGEEPGYSMHIGTDRDAALRRYRKAGFDADPEFLMMITRIHRMNPPLDSRNLEEFKRSYRRSKCYHLAPGVVSDDGAKIKPILDLAILKGVVHLRRVEDIGDNDIDGVVLRSGGVERPKVNWPRRDKRRG